MTSPHDEHDYRDFLPGLKGRRDDLLRRRRDELATMPHALRRIYVARVSRVSAALAACVGAAVLIGASVHPGYEEMVASLLPGQHPAPLSTVLLATLVCSALAYLLGRCLAEARFTHMMSRTVLAGEDVTHDVERLRHEKPEAVASRMIHRLESPAAVLPPAAMALAAPCALAYAVMATLRGGYPREGMVDAWIAGHGSTLLGIGLIGIAAALYLAFARRRHHLGTTLGIAALVSLAAAGLIHLTTSASAVVWAGGALVIAACAGSLGRIRREHRILHLDGDVRMWTVAGVMRGTWELARRTRAQLTWANIREIPGLTRQVMSRPLPRIAAGAGVLAMLCGLYLAAGSDDALAIPAQQQRASSVGPMDSAADLVTPTATPTSSTEPWKTSLDFRSNIVSGTYELDLREQAQVAIPLQAYAGKRVEIPAGWRAVVTVDAWVDDRYRTDVKVGTTPDAGDARDDKFVRFDARDHDRYIYVHVEAEGEVEIAYQITLEREPAAP